MPVVSMCKYMENNALQPIYEIWPCVTIFFINYGLPFHTKSTHRHKSKAFEMWLYRWMKIYITNLEVRMKVENAQLVGKDAENELPWSNNQNNVAADNGRQRRWEAYAMETDNILVRWHLVTHRYKGLLKTVIGDDTLVMTIFSKNF